MKISSGTIHHDASGKPDKAKTQNITIGISLVWKGNGIWTSKTNTVISLPLPNGSIYVFNKDVNIDGNNITINLWKYEWRKNINYSWVMENK